jgi:hypothetical protein
MRNIFAMLLISLVATVSFAGELTNKDLLFSGNKLSIEEMKYLLTDNKWVFVKERANAENKPIKTDKKETISFVLKDKNSLSIVFNGKKSDKEFVINEKSTKDYNDSLKNGGVLVVMVDGTDKPYNIFVFNKNCIGVASKSLFDYIGHAELFNAHKNDKEQTLQFVH